MVKYMMQETYRHGFICEGYVTVIFVYSISTVHNPDRQNYLNLRIHKAQLICKFRKLGSADQIQYDTSALVWEEHEPVRI